MSENIEKKRENGYYWVRYGTTTAIVEVENGMVYETGDGDCWSLDRFEEEAEFIAGPLEPPAASVGPSSELKIKVDSRELKAMLEVIAQARDIAVTLADGLTEIWGCCGLDDALRELDGLKEKP